MKNKIIVKSLESFILTNNGKTNLIAEVEERNYEAVLFKETEEYFAKDSKGREFLVGEINNNGDLVLLDAFEVVN